MYQMISKDLFRLWRNRITALILFETMVGQPPIYYTGKVALDMLVSLRAQLAQVTQPCDIRRVTKFNIL